MNHCQNKEFSIIVHNNDIESMFKVKSLDSIFTLINQIRSTTPYSISKLVYKNFILCHAFTFAFYGICEGSHIYAVTKEQNEQDEQKTSKTKPNIVPFLNKEHFIEFFEKKYGSDGIDHYYNFCRKNSHALEVSKLKDQFYHKIEGTIKCHRKFINNFFQCKDRSIYMGPNNNIHDTDNDHEIK